MPDSKNGTVASLHLHPIEAGAPLTEVDSIELVEAQGIRDNPRYFVRDTKRQVSLIEREQLAEHATALGHPPFPPGVARANMETVGLDLVALAGQSVKIGDAVLIFYEPRTPCHKMDALAPGLRERMENGRQGVLAQVVESGTIRVGDEITPLPSPAGVGD